MLNSDSLFLALEGVARFLKSGQDPEANRLGVEGLQVHSMPLANAPGASIFASADLGQAELQITMPQLREL